MDRTISVFLIFVFLGYGVFGTTYYTIGTKAVFIELNCSCHVCGNWEGISDSLLFGMKFSKGKFQNIVLPVSHN
jgi:hypothetical protein